MKIPSRFHFVTWKNKILMFSWGRKPAHRHLHPYISPDSVSTSGTVSTAEYCCCHGWHAAARVVFFKCRSEWKQLVISFGGRAATGGYNYDAESYSQNFDSGCSDDNPSPLAPRGGRPGFLAFGDRRFGSRL